MINEINLRQIEDMQKECYSKRVGQIYGDFKVIDVWYDWDNHQQMWKLECTKCGATKITHNGKDYIKGKNKGLCECRRTKPEKIKKDPAEQPDDSHWIGKVFGEWEVIGYKSGKGWNAKCIKCGRTTYHSAKAVKELYAPKCICEFGYGKYDGDEWVNKKYGHLTIKKYENGRFQCICDCGNQTHVKPTHLFGGLQTSCGKCKYHGEKCRTHGMSNDRIYRIWKGMISRCYNPKHSHWKTYGGRGIDICDEWRYDIFAFKKWALANGYSNDLSIDRIDNDKGYYPNNCRWATDIEQASNKHKRYTFTKKPEEQIKYKRKNELEINGETKSAIEWCAQYGLSVPFVMYRIKSKGMTPYEALTTPKLTDGRPKNK